MAPHARTCPDCGQRWPQRDARFCGLCGAGLPTGATASARRRYDRRNATRLLGAVATVALLAAATTIDLARPAPDPTVRIDEDLTPAGNPLSPSEASALRAQADPDRLRCEPRGCELWRIARAPELRGSGVVELGDGLVLVVAEHDVALDDGTADPGAPGVSAIDTATGEERWRWTLDGSSRHDWLQLTPGPAGALVRSTRTVTSLDRDGELLWTWQPDVVDGRHLDVWDATGFDSVVIVRSVDPGDGHDDYDYREWVTALDASTGRARWSRATVQSMVEPPDLVVVRDDDGSLRSVDPVSGGTSWELTDGGHEWVERIGPWLAANSDGGFRLLDAQTGDEVGGSPGWLAAPPRRIGDVWLVVVGGHPPEDGAEGPIPLQLLALDADGSTSWSSPLGEPEEAWSCCPVVTGPNTGKVLVTVDERILEFDLGTGELLTSETLAPGMDNGPVFGFDAWQPTPGLGVEWHRDRQRIDLRTDEGSVVIRGGQYLDLYSVDPLVVSDHRHLMGIRIVPD